MADKEKMLYQTEIKELKLFKRGKVRDVYELDDKLLIVATDRISCFDSVLPTPIPDKGKILTKLSLFWFSYLRNLIKSHLLYSETKDLPSFLEPYKEILEGRFMVVKKAEVLPFECVVRGYISGSAWKEYEEKGSVCGINLSAGLKESEELAAPIFTPATKAASGHDENVDFSHMKDKIGAQFAQEVKEVSLAIYKKAHQYAQSKGIIIADTKFEFGKDLDRMILVDEVLTPDSSRFWPKAQYTPGGLQASFDKQFVRDYLIEIGWDKNPPAPPLPPEIVEKTQSKYQEALKSLVT